MIVTVVACEINTPTLFTRCQDATTTQTPQFPRTVKLEVPFRQTHLPSPPISRVASHQNRCTRRWRTLAKQAAARSVRRESDRRTCVAKLAARPLHRQGKKQRGEALPMCPSLRTYTSPPRRRLDREQYRCTGVTCNSSWLCRMVIAHDYTSAPVYRGTASSVYWCNGVPAYWCTSLPLTTAIKSAPLKTEQNAAQFLLSSFSQ